MCVRGGLVVLWPAEGDNDYVVRVPLAQIESVEVDWPVAGGKITLHTAHRRYIVVFAEGDEGLACADAIQQLEGAFP
jgi:hypothetical protein